MKKYIILLLVIAYGISMLFMGTSCKEEVPPPEEVVEKENKAEVPLIEEEIPYGGEVRLTNNPATDWSPSWSPDGKKIAFDSYRDGNGEIYVMNADGSGQINLTNNPADDGITSWSPDGKMIAFVSGRDGNDEIYVLNINAQE